MVKLSKIIFWIIIAIVLALTVILALQARGATNISAITDEHFAWDDINGWWDFYATDGVIVDNTHITGYASSTAGFLSLDCATSPAGNICATSNYGICNGSGPHNPDNGICPNAQGNGVLTGYAWNDQIGWVSFNCDQSTHGGPNTCATASYEVSISGSNGIFSGCAWNDIVGWISFNNTGPCPSGITHKVVTAWRATSTVGTLESLIFDTGLEIGGVLNGIIWQGSQPNGTCVKFQIAVSDNPAGPWDYYGPDHLPNQYFGQSGATCELPGNVIEIKANDRLWVNNKRYLRYKIFLESDQQQTATPIVNDVILNWSR